MTLYHAALLGLAGLATLACLPGLGRLARCEALLALGAMGLAMLGALPLLAAGAAVLVLLALRSLCAAGWAAPLCLHRTASNLVMAAVLGGLFLLNGAGICGPAALPLLSPEGMTRLPMPRLADLYLLATVAVMGLYLAGSLALSLVQLRPGRRRNARALMEILPMTCATLGMGLGTG